MASRRPPSILFLTSGRREPSSRFRVGQFLPLLGADGFDVRVAPCVPPKYLTHRDLGYGGWPLTALLTAAKVVNRLVALFRTPFHDLVFLEREVVPRLTPVLERLAASLSPALHFDFDDAIHLKYAGRDPNPVEQVVRLASGVTAGNEWLGAWARRASDRVTVLPTAIDTRRFTPGSGGDVPLVWTGTSSTLPYLEALAPVLRRVKGARIIVICNRPPGDLGIPTSFVPWNDALEVTALRRGRVGLMPLPDTEWSRGKCGFKLLQYMACGIPCVASPIGVNPEILDGGSCGMLASSEETWIDALERLGSDAGLRRRLAESGRARVEGAYSVAALYPRFRAALRGSMGD